MGARGGRGLHSEQLNRLNEGADLEHDGPGHQPMLGAPKDAENGDHLGRLR